MYGYPVDARKSYIFFCTYSSMETIVISSGWLVFISTFNFFVPTGNKDDNNNNNNNKESGEFTATSSNADISKTKNFFWIFYCFSEIYVKFRVF